jgi:DNA-binding transcriptional LysR family regulator
MDVQAMSRLIVSGMGAGVLPRHVVDRLNTRGTPVHIFQGCGKPVTNAISLAYLRDRNHSRGALTTMNELRDAVTRLKR